MVWKKSICTTVPDFGGNSIDDALARRSNVGRRRGRRRGGEGGEEEEKR